MKRRRPGIKKVIKRARKLTQAAAIEIPRDLDPGEQGSAIELNLDARLKKAGYYFSKEKADHVCAFFETFLRHSKGVHAGKPFVLAAWQRMKLRRLFGWRRPDGTRRYRRSSWWVPRKNGKSTFAAGIALYLTSSDGEAGAQVFSFASNEDQAGVVHNEAKQMVRASPDLEEVAQVLKKTIYVPSSGSVYRVLASKAASQHGLNVHGVVGDEIHAIKSRELYDVLTTAQGSRVQPLELTISTAGNDVGSWAFELYEYSKKVATGVLEDPAFLPVVYEADPTDDWRDESTWAKANPNLGVSISIEYLREEMIRCRGMPGRIAAFKQLYLNIWAQVAEAWLDLNQWRACLVKARPIGEYKGKRCWGGLDLSSTTDLTALALVFDMEDDGPLEAACFFWVPRDTAREHERADNTTYVKWIGQGYIRATAGNVVDYDWVERDLVRVAKYCNLAELAFDRWGATQIVQRLQDEHGITMVQFGQGYKDMSPASKELERLVLSRGLRIVDNPVLTWNASNAVVMRDPAGNIKPDKRRRGQKIDGVVALIMALARATLGAEAASGYESHGIRSV